MMAFIEQEAKLHHLVN